MIRLIMLGCFVAALGGPLLVKAIANTAVYVSADACPLD